MYGNNYIFLCIRGIQDSHKEHFRFMLVFTNQRRCATRLVVFEMYGPTKIEWEKIKVRQVLWRSGLKWIILKWAFYGTGNKRFVAKGNVGLLRKECNPGHTKHGPFLAISISVMFRRILKYIYIYIYPTSEIQWNIDINQSTPIFNYPLSYGVPVRERYGSTLLPATREQHDQNCTQSH